MVGSSEELGTEETGSGKMRMLRHTRVESPPKTRLGMLTYQGEPWGGRYGQAEGAPERWFGYVMT